MSPEDLKQRTFDFALRIISVVKALPPAPENRRLASQLFGSGTSVGANYRAAQRAKSKKDFATKIATVVEEADESCYWLEIIIASKTLPENKIQPLLKEANELTAIFSATLKTTRNNLNK